MRSTEGSSSGCRFEKRRCSAFQSTPNPTGAVRPCEEVKAVFPMKQSDHSYTSGAACRPEWGPRRVVFLFRVPWFAPAPPVCRPRVQTPGSSGAESWLDLSRTAGFRSGPRASLSPAGLNLKWALKRLQEPGVHEPSTWNGPQHQPVPKPTHISHVVGDSGR